jgi:hypothetical protein
MNEDDLNASRTSTDFETQTATTNDEEPAPTEKGYQNSDATPTVTTMTEDENAADPKFMEAEGCCDKCCDGCINCCLSCFIPGCWALTFGICCCGLCRNKDLPML